MIGEFSNACIFVVLVSQSDASSSNIQVAPRSKSMSELHDEEQKQTRPGATVKKDRNKNQVQDDSGNSSLGYFLNNLGNCLAKYR